jgi:hypothetical protein
VYLDLERPSDRQKLTDAEAYLSLHSQQLVILDEVQHMPKVLPVLRSLIDEGRRSGPSSGRFLLLGSASGELLQQSGEGLAGRIAYLELAPLHTLEVGAQQQNTLWLRGGFPSSLLASSDVKSMDWRRNLISTYLERELPGYGSRLPAQTLRRLWTMLAHLQGGLLDVSQLAKGLMIDTKTVHRYLDMLGDLMLLRKLMPWHSKLGKRLIKSPKLYVRDSGLLHALLGLSSLDALMAHPVMGNSWEGFVIENTARQWARAGVLHPVIAYSTEVIEIWFAKELNLGERRLDTDEFLDVFTASPAELMAACQQGRLTDAKTLTGLLWLQNVQSGQWPLQWQTVS